MNRLRMFKLKRDYHSAGVDYAYHIHTISTISKCATYLMCFRKVARLEKLHLKYAF